MVEHLTEDEQIEALKKWWKENGRAIIVGVVLGVGVIIGFWKWKQYTETHALAASLEYDNFSQFIIDDKPEQIASSFSLFKSEHADTSYATLAALLYASYEYKKNNTEKALESLRWATDNSGHEALLHVAQIRLARLLVSENKLDEAFNIVAKLSEPVFDSQYEEIKGDIYAKRGEQVLARSSYQLALGSTKLGGKQREYVQMKLDNLDTPILNSSVKPEISNITEEGGK